MRCCLHAIMVKRPGTRQQKVAQVEILEKLWNWAKEIQLNPEELQNAVLSTCNYGKTAWYKAAESGQVEILEKLCTGLRNCN